MSRTFLGLSDIESVPEGYERYIWSGYGCVKGIAYCKDHGLPYEIIPENWKNEAEERESSEYIRDFRERLISTLMKELNDYHGVSYGDYFWKILLTSWLRVFLVTYYDKYLILKRADSMLDEAEVRIYDKWANDLVIDYAEYTQRIHESDEFHLFQYSRILNSIPDGFKHIFVKKTGTCRIDNAVETDYSRKGVREYVKNMYLTFTEIYDRLRRAEPEVIVNPYDVGFSHEFVNSLWKKSKGRIRSYEAGDYARVRQSLEYAIDARFRERKPDFNPHNEFEDFIKSEVYRELPLVYLESFLKLGDICKSRYKCVLNANHVIYGATTITFDEMSKRLVAHLKQNGAKLYGTQHGGAYGIYDRLYNMDEYSLADVYFSWGWDNQMTENMVFSPMPALKLFGEKNKGNSGQKENGILYISYYAARYHVKISNFEFCQYERIEKEKGFLKELSALYGDELAVRLFPHDFGWGIKNGLDRDVPGLKYDNNRDISDSLDAAELVVITAMETVVCEAAAKNIPFLVLLDMRAVHPTAQKDMRDLIDSGIACTDWEELLDRIQEIKDRVNSWWNEPHRRQVVESFRNKYAYAPEDAMKIWESKLLDIK